MHCVIHMTYSIYSSGCSSLEMIVGLESNSKIFTVSVQGLLELQVSSTPSRTNRKNLYLFNIFFITVVFFLSLCRPDSTPPYSWITQRVPPSQYRTVQISWACCSAYSLTHEQGYHPSCPLLPLSFFYFIFFPMDCLWAPPHGTKPQGGFEGRKRGWHWLDCLSDGERTVWRTQGLSLFFTVRCHFPPTNLDACCFTNKITWK